MKVAKIRKKEQKREVKVEQEYSIKQMIKILCILAVIFITFYFITTLLVDNKPESDNDVETLIDSTQITMNQLLNRKEEEYYVLVTKASLYESSYLQTNYLNIYKSYVEDYKKEEDSLMFYYVDLDSALNKKYYSDELNITDNVEEIKLNNEVLFKIKNGKIEKNYVGKDRILDKLSRL